VTLSEFNPSGKGMVAELDAVFFPASFTCVLAPMMFEPGCIGLLVLPQMTLLGWCLVRTCQFVDGAVIWPCVMGCMVNDDSQDEPSRPFMLS